MATVRYAAFLAIVLGLRCCSTAANFTIPFLSPLLGDNMCKSDVCGKGKCVASNASNFGFQCECDAGWKQSRSDDDQSFKFLPCIIPNCSLNFHCSQAPPPVAVKQKNASFSFFDPCFWTDCGGGSCNKTSPFTRTCLCEEGYYNLFNSTTFPCFKECAIGGDCANLGLDIFNSSNSSNRPNPTVVNDNNSHASSLIPRVQFGWMITMLTALVLVVSEYS